MRLWQAFNALIAGIQTVIAMCLRV